MNAQPFFHYITKEYLTLFKGLQLVFLKLKYKTQWAQNAIKIPLLRGIKAKLNFQSVVEVWVQISEWGGKTET